MQVTWCDYASSDPLTCLQTPLPQGPARHFLGPLYTIGGTSWPKQEAVGIPTGRAPQLLAFDVPSLMAREAQTVVTRQAQHRLLRLTRGLNQDPPPGFDQVRSCTYQLPGVQIIDQSRCLYSEFRYEFRDC